MQDMGDIGSELLIGATGRVREARKGFGVGGLF